MLKEWITKLVEWYVGTLDSGGYPLVVLLMVVESSFLPLPSELVIPPAAHLAHTQGRFSMPGLVMAGTLGSWIGASLMYWGARWAGRPLVLRYGKFFLVGADKVEAAERWAARFGPAGIFVSRLLPVVRHLIGIPAGIVRMDFKKYSIFTVAGSALWCGVLCWLGVVAGRDEKLLQGELHRVLLWGGGVLAVLGVLYFFCVHRYMKPKG